MQGRRRMGDVPLVRPPRFAQGGGAADAFAGSGAPGLASGGRDARDLSVLYSDDERGRFTERIFAFPQFAALVPGGTGVAGTTDAQTIQVTSVRSSFVRLVALRGVLQFSNTLPLTGLERAALMLRIQIDGEEDLTTSGTTSNPASFAALFADSAAPWLWFAAPPRLRAGDIVQATVTNNAPGGGPTLTPEVVCRLVDDEWWQSLYGT
jgi:hypothetical protein